MFRRAALIAAAFTLSSACIADEKPGPEAKERAVIDQATKTYDDELASARRAHDETLKRAGKKLLAAYDIAIAAAMKSGGGKSLDLANELNDEKKIKAMLIDNTDADIEASDANSVSKILTGAWTIVETKQGHVSFIGEWTFGRDGSVISRADGHPTWKGSWKLEQHKKRVLITWEAKDAWDAFKLPLNPNLTVGESWVAPDLMVAQRTKADPSLSPK
jgi:hypothetical protein